MNVFNRSLTKTLPTVFFNCTLNNTIATFVNNRGFQIITVSCGHLKYKGANKGTKIAAQQVIATIGNYVLNFGHHKIIIQIRGFGKGRSSIIKELTKLRLNIVNILDQERIAFNGCRRKRTKR